MKRVIVWCVIGSLLTPGVVWAQESVSAPANEWSRVACDGGRWAQVPATAEKWDTLTPAEQAVMCVQYAVPGPVSRKLAMVGAGSALLGAVWLLPQGENYSVLGHPYCVGSNYVDAGSCQMPFGSAKIPLVMIGAGVVMMIIGLQRKK